MSYSALFAIHLLAVTTFVAILLLTSASLPSLTRALPSTKTRIEITRLRRMNLYLASPALLLVWACGIAMASEAGWYLMGWLKLKAALVLLASAIHGRQMAALRRLGSLQARGYGALGLAIVIVAGAAILALTKPF